MTLNGEMRKFSLWIFTGAAVLYGGTASPYDCIGNQLFTATSDLFFVSATPRCQNIEKKFDDIRMELEKCTRFEVNISLAKSLYTEYCTNGSYFRRTFDNLEECILSPYVNILMKCVYNKASPNVSSEDIPGETLDEICTSLSLNISECQTEDVARYCAREGREVYGRIAKASEPFFKGICLSTAYNEKTEGYFDDEVRASASGLSGGAYFSCIFWCILSWLLFTEKTSRSLVDR